MSQIYQPGGAHLPINHPPSVNEPSSEVDDIDMDMASTSSLATGDAEIKYICLDTNILVHHLPLVAQLHTFLCSGDTEGHCNSGGRGRGGWCLLVPTVVINELDKLSSSTAPALQGHFDAPLTIGDLTQAATHWLGRTTLATPSTPHSRPGETDTAPAPSDPLGDQAHSVEARPASRLRLQAWDERLHPPTTLTKGDDRVLDCCLYYRQHYTTRVVLWTQDKNLSILATANRVDVLKVPRMSLAGVAMALKLDLPARLSMQNGHGHGQDRSDSARQYGMDLDLDLDLDSTLHDSLDMQYEANDHLRALLPDSTAFAALNAPAPSLPSRIPPHAQSPSHSRSSSHSHRTTPPSSIVIPLDILRQFDTVFFPFATYLANLAARPSPPPPPIDPITIDTTSPPTPSNTTTTTTTATATAALIQHAYDSFDHLDATRFPPIVPGQTKMTPDRMAVLRAMGCLKTLCLFLVPRDARRPRRGEVIEALQDLAEQLAFLHVPIDAHTVRRLVEDIQNLSA